jgi:hypothetical protein
MRMGVQWWRAVSRNDCARTCGRRRTWVFPSSRIASPTKPEASESSCSKFDRICPRATSNGHLNAPVPVLHDSRDSSDVTRVSCVCTLTAAWVVPRTILSMEILKSSSGHSVRFDCLFQIEHGARSRCILSRGRRNRTTDSRLNLSCFLL